MSAVRCSTNGCETLLDEPVGLPSEQRQPCPNCGSLGRIYEKKGTTTVRAHISADASVERGLNELRLAVLGIIVTIGLTVGFGLSASWPIRFGAGAGAFIGSAGLIAWPRSRHLLMAFMHRLTRR